MYSKCILFICLQLYTCKYLKRGDLYIIVNKEVKELRKVKYQIKMNKKTYIFKSDKNINQLNSNPALYFLSDGDYEVKECGQLKAFNYLKSHMTNIAKLVGTINV